MPSLPPNLEARLQVARDHHQQGLLGDAEAGYIEVLLKAPNNFETNFALGVVAYQLGQPERAIRLFQKAISVNPSAPVPRATALDKNHFADVRGFGGR